jgi:putative membrane protein
MHAIAPRLRVLLLALFGIYIFVYPWSILLVSLDWVPVWGVWMGSALLILQGTMMGLWLIANHGRYGALITFLILFLSWGIEHIGVTTGFPFGAYHYTDVLSPKVIGVVPMAIPFAWLLVVPAAVGMTDRLLGLCPTHMSPAPSSKSHIPRMLMKIFGAASFTVLLDVTIEPVAVHINGYWTWNSIEGGFYGVPLSNFAAWWVTSMVLVAMLVWLRRFSGSTIAPASPQSATNVAAQTKLSPKEGYRFIPHTDADTHTAGTNTHMIAWLPPALYMLNLTMFVLVNVAHAQIIAALIGGMILCYLAFDWFKPVIKVGVKPALRRITGVARNQRRRQRET